MHVFTPAPFSCANRRSCRTLVSTCHFCLGSWLEQTLSFPLKGSIFAAAPQSRLQLNRKCSGWLEQPVWAGGLVSAHLSHCSLQVGKRVRRRCLVWLTPSHALHWASSHKTGTHQLQPVPGLWGHFHACLISRKPDSAGLGQSLVLASRPWPWRRAPLAPKNHYYRVAEVCEALWPHGRCRLGLQGVHHGSPQPPPVALFTVVHSQESTVSKNKTK